MANQLKILADNGIMRLKYLTPMFPVFIFKPFAASLVQNK